MQVDVSDTGIGIAQEHHERVFEAFSQVDGGNNRRYEGTGLGLSLTRKLVELQGGKISFESAKGKGSTFTVQLPIHATPHRAPHGMSPATADDASPGGASSPANHP